MLSLQLHTHIIHITIRNVNAVKKCCYVLPCADTQRDFQLGNYVSRENLSPKGFLGINKQVIALFLYFFIFFFSSNQEQLLLRVETEHK